MQFSIDRAEFVQGLSLTQGVVERRSTMPILGNVLLEVTDDLSVSATDLEIYVRWRCKAKIVDPGVATIGARKLYELIRELKPGEVTLRSIENHYVEIVSGRSSFRLVGLSSQDFPSLPQAEQTGSWTLNIDAAILKQMIDRTLFAVSTDDTRAHLGGVLLTGAKDILRLVGTDGHRLALVDQPMKGANPPEKGVILPRKGLGELHRLLEGREGGAVLRLAGNTARVDLDDVSLVMRLLDGEFPNYEQVIPSSSKLRILVGKEDLLSALRRVSVVASDRARGVKLQLTPGVLTVSASSPDFGEAREEIEITYDGDELAVGFNSRYLTDVLSVLPDGCRVEIGLIDDGSPGVLRAEDDETYSYIAMPMRL